MKNKLYLRSSPDEFKIKVKSPNSIRLIECRRRRTNSEEKYLNDVWVKDKAKWNKEKCD